MRPRFTHEILATKGFLPNGTKAKKVAVKVKKKPPPLPIRLLNGKGFTPEGLKIPIPPTKEGRKQKLKTETSDLSIKFINLWVNLGGGQLVREHYFHPFRNWRFDYAIPEHKIAIEIDGGAFTGGRHTRGVGFIQDCDKLNEATALGWSIYRITTPMVNTADVAWVLEQIRSAKFNKEENSPHIVVSL